MSEKSNMNPRVLVLGASGQVGSAFIKSLGTSGVPAGRAATAHDGNPTWVQLDLQAIADKPSIIDGLVEKHKFAAVICAAGATDVERCESDPRWAESANFLGPAALASEARAVPFIFFSTDYVFDGTAGPYEEPDEPKPLSVYGRTKLAGERAILEAHPGALVVRTTGVYGPDRQGKNFLYTLRRLLVSGQAMRVPTDQVATPTHNEDIVNAVLALLELKAAGILHIAGPEFISRYDFARLACGILSLDERLLLPVQTNELAQKAARPLLGGLRIETLQMLLGKDVMRPPAAGIADWLKATASQ